MEITTSITILATLLATLSEAAIDLTTSLNAKPAVSTSTLSVFESGSVSITNYSVPTSDQSSPPRSLLIVTPDVQGTYPVMLFHHGFALQNYFYTELLRHIASYGYIIVAPQLYGMTPISGPRELERAAEVANWIRSGLSLVLPQNVRGDLKRLTLGGHSRGGKAAFALALGLAKTPLKVQFSALMGVDPVEGIEPNILTKVPHSFNLSIPVTIIGTGLGSQWNFLMKPCAPNGLNHKEFFYESNPPAGHFVTTNYGHMDMLNDDSRTMIGRMADMMCKSGKGSKEPMRKTVGGIMVAFLQACLEGESENYLAILDDPSVAPIELDPVEFKGEDHEVLVAY